MKCPICKIKMRLKKKEHRTDKKMGKIKYELYICTKCGLKWEVKSKERK